MAVRSRSTAAEEEAVFQSVKRACYGSLDSVTLRQEAARRADPVLRADGWALSVMDPDTGIFTHAVAQGLSAQAADRFMREIYPLHEVIRFPDLARSGQVVAVMPASAPIEEDDSFHSGRFFEMLRDEGFAFEMRAALCVDGDAWGAWCVMRRPTTGVFGEREVGLLRRLAPHVGRGLRAATLRDSALADPGADADPGSPGVVVIDAHGRITLQNAAAAAQLEDLADVGMPAARVPVAIHSIVGAVHARHTGAAAALDDAPLEVESRARGRSGRWYALRASLTEPDASGESQVVVILSPMMRAELAPMLARLYGLTPREREVAALVARGEPTRKIASRLGLSHHTVQDYLYKACDKIGVRGRRRLVAKLFFDAYAPLLGAKS